MTTADDMIAALKAGDTDRVSALLRSDPSLSTTRDAAGVSMVLLAIYLGRNDLAQLLRAERQALDIFEASALGSLGEVTSLVRSDAGLANAYSSDGFTPLHLAAFFGHPGVARLLLDCGAEANAESRNDSRLRPIHSAAAHRQPAVSLEIVRLLLARGADPNLKQEKGYAPLHQAAAHANLKMVELLLDHRAEVNSRTDDGRTPLTLARDNGHDAASELLRRRGGVE
jgi:ankyrin repeat protein